MRKIILKLVLALLIVSCKNETKKEKSNTIFEVVNTISDSIVVGEMTINNAFKHQILAHKDSRFDSLTIFNKVYLPNKNTFDNCLGMIFGDENGMKFKPAGIYDWNKNLIIENKDLIESKLSILDSIDINQLFENHLTAVQEMTGQKGKGKWMIYMGPKDFQIFGGCDKNSMILDMFGEAWNTKSINDLFAHEIEHLIFEPIAQKDPNGNTGLGITLDEGLAVYFTYVYLDQDLKEALYGDRNMLLFNREKEIFDALQPYLFKTIEEGCPIFKHCGRSDGCQPIIDDIPEDMQDELCYFLGFRIIENYVKLNGKDSWKDIYKISLKEFYEKSGYKEFIDSKK